MESASTPCTLKDLVRNQGLKIVKIKPAITTFNIDHFRQTPLSKRLYIALYCWIWWLNVVSKWLTGNHTLPYSCCLFTNTFPTVAKRSSTGVDQNLARLKSPGFYNMFHFMMPIQSHYSLISALPHLPANWPNSQPHTLQLHQQPHELVRPTPDSRIRRINTIT